MKCQTSSELSAADYLSALLESNPDGRLKRSLERIKEACDQIEADLKARRASGRQVVGRPMSVVAVAQRCTELFGGPTAGSIINNRAKEPHKARYIEMRAAELVLPVSRELPSDPLSAISDPQMRLYVKSLQNKVTEQERIIRGFAKRMREAPPISFEDVLSATMDVVPAVVQAAAASESKALRDAILRLTSPDVLARVGLRIENEYVFENLSQAELLEPHHVAALRSLLR